MTEHDMLIRISTAIRRRLSELECEQRQFAEDNGIPYRTLISAIRIHGRKQDIRLFTLKDIADGLGMTMAELFREADV